MLKDRIEKANTLILPIMGGLGRNIFATAMIRNLKQAYPEKKLFVVAGSPEIFFNNPHIKRVYGFQGLQHLYEDYIEKNPETMVLEVEPYRHVDYISGELHIVRAWCDLLEIPCSDITPELYLTRGELEMADAFMSRFDKPLILLQHCGGQAPQNPNDPMESLAKQALMFRRSLRPQTVQKVADQLLADGYAVGSIQAPTQFCPTGAERVAYPIRAVLCLIPKAAGIIAIDSFVQHAAAALNKKALVLWAGTSPDRLGYPLHKNIRRSACETPECHRPNTYAFDVQADGSLWSCPFSDACTNYDAEEIVKHFKEMQGAAYIDNVKNFVKATPTITVNNPNVTTCLVHKNKDV